MERLLLLAPLTDAQWWMQHGEAVTVAVFFVLLLLLACLERVAPRHLAVPHRAQRWPANAALTALNVMVMGLVPLSLIGAALLAETAGFGLLCQMEASTTVTIVVTLGARSFLSFGTHWLMHHVPWLWRVHRVHHLDTHLDVSTTVRFHPLEVLVQAAIGVPLVLLMGLSPLVLVLYEVADAAVTVWSHANVRWPSWLDRLLRRVLVTPDLHRVHHSTLVNESNSNFGAVLTVWDQLFGTFRTQTSVPLDRMSIGLQDLRDARTDRTFWLLRSPWLDWPAADGLATLAPKEDSA
jgi:sterol desaturase/sphingolipid hydroxylase (fatty acid hydroxylase superfamily)